MGIRRIYQFLLLSNNFLLAFIYDVFMAKYFFGARLKNSYEALLASHTYTLCFLFSN